MHSWFLSNKKIYNVQCSSVYKRCVTRHITQWFETRCVNQHRIVRYTYLFAPWTWKWANFLTCLATASCRSVTISCPSTPEHLKPFVHVTRRDLFRPSWLHGKEKVNPIGSDSFSKLCSSKNSRIPFAMWLNNWKIKGYY